jgi:hypothetical protein
MQLDKIVCLNFLKIFLALRFQNKKIILPDMEGVLETLGRDT